MSEESNTKNELAQVKEELKFVIEALEDKKGDNIRVFDIREQSSVTDYVILVSAISQPHAKALKINLDKMIAERGISVIGNDNESSSGWMVLDAFNFMVHIQTAEMRSLYELEELWKGAAEVDFS
ncbi:MAG: ribosome silencing factor [Opitutae bacterium]|jgi:ribosome-associated protein|nr:ribosome silencing factor [Opitutae bacterium]